MAFYCHCCCLISRHFHYLTGWIFLRISHKGQPFRWWSCNSFRRRVTKGAKPKVQNVATKQKSFLANNVRTRTRTDANSNHMFRGLRNLNIVWTGSTVYWDEGEFQPCVCWSVTASRPGSHQSAPQNLHVEFPVGKLQLYTSSTIMSIAIQLLNKESALFKRDSDFSIALAFDFYFF